MAIWPFGRPDYHFHFTMRFLLEKRDGLAIAHPSTCPEVPVDKGDSRPGQWSTFDSLAAIQDALAHLRTRGADAHWCRCQVCRQFQS